MSVSGLPAVLLWCQKRVKEAVHPAFEENPVKVTNFTRSWADGRAFIALCSLLDPDAVQQCTSFASDTEKIAAHKLAFQILHDKIGVPELLEAEDMLLKPYPDKLSVATYLIEVRRRWDDSKVVAAVKEETVHDRNSRRERCPLCSRAVDAGESTVVSGAAWHSACYKKTREVSDPSIRTSASSTSSSGTGIRPSGKPSGIRPSGKPDSKPTESKEPLSTVRENKTQTTAIRTSPKPTVHHRGENKPKQQSAQQPQQQQKQFQTEHRDPRYEKPAPFSRKKAPGRLTGKLAILAVGVGVVTLAAYYYMK